ncbi:MAG: hypothetical protein HYX73_05315 [Acidobacteria bacterium]|nr:hypothetical protein [Acidobacteriota bacterium]
MKKLLGPVFIGLLSSVSLFAQFGPTGTTTLQVIVGTEAAIQVDTGTTSLTTAGSFADYTGSTDYTYKIRTTQVGGTGAITLQITSDFSPAGGPSVAAPPSAGDTLDYTCTAAAPATGCAGPLTASTAAATSVATFGADARSALAGNSGNSVDWTLTNDPQYVTGTYNATATFTISAT